MFSSIFMRNVINCISLVNILCLSINLKSGSGSAFIDLLFIVTSIVGVCNCSVFCCTLLYVHSSFAIILMGKRELVALLSLSSWCLIIVV